MKLLADENIERAIVDWLRTQSHDVVWIADISPSVDDEHVVLIALNQGRVLLTSDLDFGELAYLRDLAPGGVVLLRFHAATQQERLELLQGHWPTIEQQALGHFIVAANRKLRIRPLSDK